jgi:hypothetical protein
MDYYKFDSTCSNSTNTCTKAPFGYESMIMHWCDKSCGAECQVNTDCNDNNSLTTDVCTDNCVCEHTQKAECVKNSDCDNGIYCDGVEKCIDGKCETGTPITCSSNNVNVSECSYNPDNNSMTYDYYSFNSSCSENLGCAVNPVSWPTLIMHWCDKSCGAKCELDTDCNDNNVTTSDKCVGCECTHEPIVCTNDSSCDDGIYCNGIESCNNGTCVSGAPTNCSYLDVNIAKCDFDPNNSKTMDQYAFNSVCDEKTDSCSLMPSTWLTMIKHWCDKDCGATCQTNLDCNLTKCSQLNGCYDGSYRTYSDVRNSCTDCSCENNATCGNYTTAADSSCDVVVETESVSPHGSSGGSGGIYYPADDNNNTSNDTNTAVSSTGGSYSDNINETQENTTIINTTANLKDNTKNIKTPIAENNTKSASLNSITGNVIGSNIFKPIGIVSFIIVIGIIGLLLIMRKRMRGR